MSTVFEKIAARELPATILYESDQVMVIENIDPKAPVHVLAFTKQPFVSVDELMENQENQPILWELFAALHQVAGEKGIRESGYKLVANCGPDASQSVPHLHIHLLGGTRLQDGT